MEPVRLLRERGIEPHIYYANSNIHPADEYAHRLDTIRTWTTHEGVAFTEGSYDPAAWEKTAGRIGDAARERYGVIIGDVREDDEQQRDGTARDADDSHSAEQRHGATHGTSDSHGAGRHHGATHGVGDSHSAESAGSTCSEKGTNVSRETSAGNAEVGASAEADAEASADALSHSPEAEQARQARCRACYRLRFEESARYAASHGFDALGTTLSVSPYQYTNIIREELERACAQAGIDAFFEDYRPYYDEATRRSRAEGLYRQNFCGCRLSDEEAAAERAERKRLRAAHKAAKRAAHAEERAAEEKERAARKAERAVYDKKQARKRAVLKALREQQK